MPLSDATATQSGPDPRSSATSRRHARLERQARVGLLPNPNRPPIPPPRRAALMGKWLDLRSSRRIRAAERAQAIAAERGAVPPAAAPPVAPEVRDTIARDESGQVSGIDINGLMDAVRGVGTDKPIRTPYAAQYRHDLAMIDDSVEQDVRKPSVLSAQAWLDDLAEEPGRDPVPQPAMDRPAAARPRLARRIAFAFLGGVLVAAMLLLWLGA